MALFSQNETGQAASLPRHVAIIMDGNGRWATRRGLPRTAGHKEGAETLRTISAHCRKIGVKYLTVYAFSTENWKRPRSEVDTIMSLLDKYLRESIEKMVREQIRLKFFGDTTVFSPKLRALIAEVEELSRHIDGVQANICINYGGRDEIVRAARQFARECAAGEKRPEDLTEALFPNYLWSAGIPEPELLIRTGGEMRISNFLLWQIAYSEIYVTDTLWPDFDPAAMDEAIAWYQTRDRRFGGLNKK